MVDRQARSAASTRADWSDVNALTRRIWIVREGVWTWRVPLKAGEYAALIDGLRDAATVIERMANGASRQECSPEMDRVIALLRSLDATE